MALFFWLCLTTVVCILSILWSKLRKAEDHTLRLPPKVPGTTLPLLGDGSYFLGTRLRVWKPFELLMKITNEKGGAMRLLLAHLPYNILTDPESCLQVSNACLTKDGMYDLAKTLFGNGLVNSEVETWRRHRKLLLPAFNQQVLDGYMPTFNKQSRKLVDQLAAEVGKGEFDQNRYLEQATLETNLYTTLGVQGLNDSSVDQFLESVTTYFASRVFYKALNLLFRSDYVYNFTSFKRNEDKVNKLIHNFAEEIIQKRKAELKVSPIDPTRKFKSVLDILLTDGTLTDMEIRDEVITMIIASYDTSAITMTYALTLIASYPEVQEKLYEELNTVFEGSDRDVEKEDLFHLKYLEAVLKESLRLYTTTPIVTRYIHQDVKLKDYTLPAGTNCMLALHGVHRSPAWGPDAEEFRPERWFEKDVPTHAFAAFSYGKRSCIGKNFAMMSMKTIFSHILRNYRLYGDHSKMKIKFYAMIKPVTGHEIRIENRRNTHSCTKEPSANGQIKLII